MKSMSGTLAAVLMIVLTVSAFFNYRGMPLDGPDYPVIVLISLCFVLGAQFLFRRRTKGQARVETKSGEVDK